MAATVDSVREKALQDYRKKLLEHKEVESRLKEGESHVRQNEIRKKSSGTTDLKFITYSGVTLCQKSCRHIELSLQFRCASLSELLWTYGIMLDFYLSSSRTSEGSYEAIRQVRERSQSSSERRPGMKILHAHLRTLGTKGLYYLINQCFRLLARC